MTRLILNSPFLEFPQGSTLSHLGAFWGSLFPFGRITDPVSAWYAKSLHADFKGEWRFNTQWKPIEGFDAFFGWIRAVVRVQDWIKDEPRLAAGPGHALRPVRKGPDMVRDVSPGGSVLDVNDIKRLGPKIGSRVEIQEIAGGKHDLVLSCTDARTRCLNVMIEWLV